MKKTEIYVKRHESKNSDQINEYSDDNNLNSKSSSISDKENQNQKQKLLKIVSYPRSTKNQINSSNTKSDLDVNFNAEIEDDLIDVENINLQKKNLFNNKNSKTIKSIPKHIKILKKPYPRRDLELEDMADYEFQNNLNLEKENTEEDKKAKDLSKNKNTNEEQEILRYMCLPLNMHKMEDIKLKWQQFFISSQRVIPDINRCINNKPENVYYEYIKDLIDEFTDKQVLFALKNILLNEDITKGYELQFILRDLFYRLKSHGTYDLSSKLNIIILYEVIFLFDLIEYKLKNDDKSLNTISGFFLQMITMIIDYQRFFFHEFTIEENLMILKSMINNNIVDIYLIKKFLKQYSDLEIVDTLKGCTYKIKYFNTEYNLNLSIFYILDNYVKICKINNEFESINDHKFKFMVKRLVFEVII